MIKKAIHIVIVFLITFSVASIVVYPEVAKLKGERDLLAKKMKRLGIQYYPDRKIGDLLEKTVYYYVNSNLRIEGNEYLAPTLIRCDTTDCFSQSSLNNVDISTIISWSFDVKDKESQKKAFRDAINVIESEYPERYKLRIISLTYYGQIYTKQWWDLKSAIPIDEENF